MDRVHRMEIFQILGIEETKDERQIRNAYREKLSVTNPEDDPEGFKRLRKAYEDACRFAKETDVVQEEHPEDITPSGRWVERAAEIYGDIHTRQDLKLWEELFADDCFLSLEDEENCRYKMILFLMGHIKLPTDVWKLLDRKLSIVSDGARLREQFPPDFVRYIQNKCEHGEEVDFSLFEGPDDGDYDLFLQYYDRIWQAFAEDRTEEAARHMENADRLGITHPFMEICRGELLSRQGKPEEALALMEELRDRYPENAMVGYHTAEVLWKQGKSGKEHYQEKAAGIYLKLKEQNNRYYMANVRLAEWYFGQGEYRKAKKCAEEVLPSGFDAAFKELLGRINAEIEKELEEEYRRTKEWKPALELCWCYLQDGKIARGIMLAVSLEKQLPPEKEAEFDGLMAKLYVEEAEYRDSITMTFAWEEILRKKLESDGPQETEKDRDRLKQAHLIRMQCYHNLGLCDREQLRNAVEEGKAVLTGSIKDIGILLEQAELYSEMEEYEQCLELVDRLVEEYQVYAAYAVSMEVFRKQYDAAGVVRSATQCIRFFPGFARPYEHLARVYLDLDYGEELEKLLEEAEKNKVKSDILEAYRYQTTHKAMDLSILNNKLIHFREKYRSRVEKGEMFLYEEGLKILTEYLYHYPDDYMFVERGWFHKAAHHYQEAKEDFEKAVSLRPENSYALNGLSQVHRALGDYEKAMVYLKKAILYRDGESPALLEDMGSLYSLLGDHRRALGARLQAAELIGWDKLHGRSLEELAECMTRAGQPDRAAKLYWQEYGRDMLKWYGHAVDLFGRSGDERKARELLDQWRKSLGLEKDNRVTGFFRLLGQGGNGVPQSDFFLQAAWVELLYGSARTAIRYFREAIACNTESGREYQLLGDAVFGCIVCGDDRRGKAYSDRLRVWLNRESFQAHDSMFNRPRSKLYYRVLSSFYAEFTGTVQALLDQQESTEICHFCTSPFCRELEGVRIMFLVRQGKRREARERLERNLELFPQEEYMLAIRHMVFGGD